MTKFEMQDPRYTDKYIEVRGPLGLEVYNDDVDTVFVERATKLMVEHLNHPGFLKILEDLQVMRAAELAVENQD